MSWKCTTEAGTWEALDSPLEAQPAETPGGGKRIFPDWPLADWDPDPDTKYARVQVRAKVDPPPSDPNQPLEVRFHPYDVDDPSAAEAPVDSESGPDNRSAGAAAGHWLVGGSTTSHDVPVMPNGDVAAVFEVAKNPGDNHRVNAQVFSTCQTVDMYGCWVPPAVDDGRLYVVGTQQPPPAAEVTEMLTVWRWLHVECDTMASFYGNEEADLVQGLIQNVAPDPTDRFLIYSKSIMGKTEQANPLFCPAWVSKIRANTESPLP